MPQRRYGMLLLIAVPLLLGVVLVLWVALRAPANKPVRLADGREARIVSVSYGREHRFIDAPPLKRALVSVLPTNVAPVLGAKVFRRHTTNDVLMVWIEVRGLTNSRFPDFIATYDVGGLEAKFVRLSSATVHSNGTAIVGFELNHFPRREPVIRFRLKEILPTNVMARLADFELKNDWIAWQESWKAEPLPQTRRDGDFEFTLLSLNTGLTATGTMRQMNMNEVWSEAVFRFGTNEPALLGTNALIYGQWKIGPLTFRDATGNQVFIREPQGRIVQQVGKLVWWRYDDGVANIPDALWSEETWKLHAQFTLTARADLPPDQLWKLNELKLPAGGQTITFNTNARLFGANVTLVSITATNPAEPGPKLHFKFQPPDDRYELRVVRATDQRGTNIVATRDLKYGGRRWAFQLRPRPGAETMNLTLGVTRRYSAEFLVKPALVRTNLAHWPTQ